MNINKTIKLALEYHRAGNLQQAASLCRKILKKQPRNADIFHMLGLISNQQGDFDAAIRYTKKAIHLKPNDFEAYITQGNALKAKGELDAAMTCYQKALQLNPRFILAYNNLGTIYRDKKQFDAAVTCYQQALQINPNYSSAYYNLGNVYNEKEQVDKAIECYQKALKINPTYSNAFNMLGRIFYEKGQVDNAISYYQQALQVNPLNAEAHWNKALALLLNSNFKEGWRGYEWRWKTEDFQYGPRNFTQPAWDGSSLQSKTLFIYAEQGVGDEIMFASCFPDIINQAGSCIIECDKRLIPLFSRSFSGTIFIERINKLYDLQSVSTQFDVITAMGRLPLFLRSSLTQFAKRKSYLIPDSLQADKWINRFKQLGEGLKVGVSWRGGNKPHVKKTRSTKLEQWKALFSIEGVNFINLQYGDCQDELMEVKQTLGITIHDWKDANPLKDLDNFAAQISALDLVISIDNATVHMAGALGIPIWTLLPFVPDWRWMLNREDSPWYPTMRLFRQPSLGDWQSVTEKVKNELLKLLK